MIYIKKDSRAHSEISYECIISKKVILRKSKKNGCFITLRLWDFLLKKYTRQRVWIERYIDPVAPEKQHNIYIVVRRDKNGSDDR